MITTGSTIQDSVILYDAEDPTAEVTSGTTTVMYRVNNGTPASVVAAYTNGAWQFTIPSGATAAAGVVAVKITNSSAIPAARSYVVQAASTFKATTVIASNMRGTDGAYTGTPPTPPSAADIRAEIDANSTQLALILEDTDSTIPTAITDLQAHGDDTWTTASGFVTDQDFGQVWTNAAITAIQSLGVMISSNQFTTNALALAPAGGGSSTINVTPLSTTVLSSFFTTVGPLSQHLSIAVGAAGDLVFVVVDANGDAINLAAKTCNFVVFAESGEGAVTTYWEEDTITIGGDDANQVTVSIDAAVNTVAGKLNYALWNTTDDQLLATGSFTAKNAPKEHTP